jgi:hypothetical protein
MMLVLYIIMPEVIKMTTSKIAITIDDTSLKQLDVLVKSKTVSQSKSGYEGRLIGQFCQSIEGHYEYKMNTENHLCCYSGCARFLNTCRFCFSEERWIAITAQGDRSRQRRIHMSRSV